MLLRRLFSISARHAAVKSPLPDVVLPTFSLTDYIWENLHRWHDKVAIECGVTGRHYKYGELRKLCRKFAGSLRRVGLQPGSTLSIVMPNSPEWPIVLLGAIEAGVVVTTANPGYTADELARQLRNCEVHGLVTISSLYPTVQKALSLTDQKTKPQVFIAPGCESDSSVPRDTVKLQDMLEKDLDSSDFSFSGSVHDTILLPYSSGTTGLPKGVMLSHWNVVSNCIQMNENSEICITEPATDTFQEILPSILPFFHAYGMCCIMFGKLAHGAKLVTLPKFDPSSFYSLLERYQATGLFLVPPMVLFLGSHPGLKEKHTKSWRNVLCGAAPIGRLDVERFLERAPNVNFSQGYGMTELGPVVSVSKKVCKKYESAGIPIPNTEMKTVDVETGEELTVGEVGEVCARGPQVMKGYFNNEEATNQTIRDGGWLYTGDLGYYDNEGCFFVVDRLKELIKVKGLQVAPAELEEVLRSHPDILDAAVIGIPDDKFGEVPKAFIVAKRSGVNEDDISKYMTEKVSAHKHLRGGIQFLDAIPKAPSGKILRRLLRESK